MFGTARAYINHRNPSTDPLTVATVASQLWSRVTQAITQRDPAAPKPRVLDNAQQSIVHIQQALHDFLRAYNLPIPNLLHVDPAPSPPKNPLVHLAAAAERYAEDPSSLIVLLVTLVAGILIGLFGLKRMSSWSSRFGSWSGRFSPFGRGDTSSTAVSDADFSYITTEDLAASQKNLGASPKENDINNITHAASTSSQPSGRSNANGETDVLVLKHKRVSYPVHFPRGAIDSGELSVRSVREAAARKMEVNDPRRIKLFFKGRQLKDDQQARAVGLRSDTESEILCVVGEGLPFSSSSKNDSPGYAQRDGGSESSSESGSDNGNSTPGGSRSKKSKSKRRRGGKKHGKKGGARSESATPEPSGAYVGGGAGSEFLGVPTATAVPPRPSSSGSNSRPPPQQAVKKPQTAMEKLEELSSKFHTTLVPLCVQFLNRPPEEVAKREFEHKKLTETVLAQVLLKLDAVETGGDDAARAKRKELVKECNNMLNRLDEVMKN
ncbi:putative apoptosis regulator bcl-2 protein bag [Botryosphaeria dothidea]|uniref:Apoptosis regulator bcl-2 protein bag n=1 Tax=Botryosphaeria dothidea TaxID=55169 RepID=A0A8H4IUQ1_9PEZI|nr:putative apoptosis regulator bcl-2 protein bag [Botryosphaeria dothidea]